MPRFSGAYTVTPNWAPRRRCCSTTSRKATSSSRRSTCRRSCPASASKTATWRIRSPAPPRRPRCSATSPRSTRTWTCRGSCSTHRRAARAAEGHFAEVTYVGNKGRNLLWQPNINIPTFEEELANQQLPAAPRTNYLRPYKGYSNITQRRSGVLGLQQRAVLSEQAPRRHQVWSATRSPR